VLSYLGGVEPYLHLDDCLLLPDVLGQVFVVRFDLNNEPPQVPTSLGLIHGVHPEGHECGDRLLDLLEHVLPQLAHRVELALGQPPQDQVNVDRVLIDVAVFFVFLRVLEQVREGVGVLFGLLRGCGQHAFFGCGRILDKVREGVGVLRVLLRGCGQLTFFGCGRVLDKVREGVGMLRVLLRGC